MPEDRPFNVYREQLTSLYRGLALWEPSPVKNLYDKVSIGDVGYVHKGFFYRMLNVTLPWDHESNTKFELDYYEPLKSDPSTDIHEATLAKGDHTSRHVFGNENAGNVLAAAPDDAAGVTYKCRGQGALLFLPHYGEHKDVIRYNVFRDYIRDNVVRWFTWSQKNGLPVERMEDLILVSGCTLVTSWAAAVFVDHAVEAKISLLSKSDGDFIWNNIHGSVSKNNSRFDPHNPHQAQDQCIFIRGFRAKKRVLFRPKLRAAAEPLPDDFDHRRSAEIQVAGIPDAPEFHDPLIGVLDYVLKKCPMDCPEDTMAIAHDDDLQLVNDVDNFTADAVQTFLLENEIPVLIENGAAILQNDAPPCPSQSHSPSHGPKLSPVKSTEHSRARFHLNPVAWLRSILSPALSTSSLAPSPCPSTPQRRALLIGITYAGSKTWPELYGPHRDVDHYQELLTTTYGYRLEDITILKDLRELPEHLQPTRVNMIRELKALVSGAAPGDKFALFYSGHSDQREALSDSEEEDSMDEMMITIDDDVIIDDELKEILIPPLPVGSSLLAILDTCHSGTLLDLPHYHCNSVYVPWQSKGERRTMTMQNINVRRQARQASGFVDSTSDIISISSAIEGQRPSDRPSDQPLEVDMQFFEDRLANKLEKFPGPRSPRSPRGTRRPRPRERTFFSTQLRCASPEASFACNGWCDYSKVPHATVVSLSACSDLQRAWEGPNGSLTAVLCNYLRKNNYPSYGEMMSHIKFQLHDNALALHGYTLDQKKKAAHCEGDGFLDGDLDNFQEPELSSLGKLHMEDILQL